MLNQVNIVVRDMAATLAFYRRLGVTIDADAEQMHASAALPNGMTLAFDATKFARQWDSGYAGATGGSTVLGFALPARDAVDAFYRDLTQAGHRGRQPPYDAFWGARYAMVEDPDGNPVGLMSPIERDRKFWPPSQPPSA